MKLPWWVTLIAFIFGAGVVAFWPDPRVVIPVTEEIPAEDFIAVVPDTVVKWTERITWRTVPAETVQVTRTRFDTVRVAAFCAAATDTTGTAAPILPAFAGRYDGRLLELSATRSDGTGYRQVSEARPPFTFSSRMSDVLVQSRRRLPRPLVIGLKLTGCAALGYGIDQLSGDRITGVAAGGGCVVGTSLPDP